VEAKAREVRMTVEEAVLKATLMPEESVLVAKPPFTWGTEAMFTSLTDEFKVPQSVLDGGFQYLLGRSELLELLEYLRNKRVSSRTIAEFVIHYAITDSFPGWISDVPDV